ncbi:peptidoglycan hydrolase-like protein with peptidoglycan-binding domain [Fontibacillus solani]|uniref:Peptidoglycan hydrolase-like protein with peptidoglycan-binding domain n=1 Tax=Fontibacillus solani TaxID=1572857 RepID=A0A7W3XQ66_9BACL|nr:peptidoglycan-binding domain-containing protein [Fontibacillus solani]MBA9084169.1 peptidoglycan hydrolase-like protein with peptidoglycan-binding domain [Fontibacillus solani]
MKKRKISVVYSLILSTSLIIAGVVSAASNDFSGWPTLQSGSSGGYVRALQANLYAFGLSGTVGSIDGSYGANTVTAVKSFQTSESLTSDGKVGSATWNAMSYYTTVTVTDYEFYLWTPSSTTYWVNYVNQSGGGLKYYLTYKSNNSVVNSGTVY